VQFRQVTSFSGARNFGGPITGGGGLGPVAWLPSPGRGLALLPVHGRARPSARRDPGAHWRRGSIKARTCSPSTTISESAQKNRHARIQALPPDFRHSSGTNMLKCVGPFNSPRLKHEAFPPAVHREMELATVLLDPPSICPGAQRPHKVERGIKAR